MKPEDILNAIGEVDDAYIKKAHRKSLFKAILVFAVIVIVACSIVVSQMKKDYILLRFNTDFSVNTEYVEPEVLIYDKWTSLEQTSFTNGVSVSTTEFKHTLYDNYSVTHTQNGEVKRITGSSGSTVWPRDYLGSKHYANLYISSFNSTDLLDRIDMVTIHSETAYGVLNQQLNCIKLEYFERSDRIHRQTLLANGGTPEETVISSRGYSYQNDRISGWKEWDAEGTLLAYAEYTYDGNVQTVSTYLSDGTLTGTRVSKYAFGNLKWREYYDADGALVGKEVYRYRLWELFFSLEGVISLFIVLSLAATAGIAVWDDRIQFGTRLVSKSDVGRPDEARRLIREANELKAQIAELSAKLPQSDSVAYSKDIQRLTEELKKLNSYLAKLLDYKPDSE